MVVCVSSHGFHSRQAGFGLFFVLVVVVAVCVSSYRFQFQAGFGLFFV